MILSREVILNASDQRRARVAVPEWAPNETNPNECFVWVGTMRADEKDAFEQNWLAGHSDLVGIRAALAALTLEDENGKRLFTLDDIAALGQKSAAPLSRIFNAACRLNAITPQDVDDLEKNSEATDDASSCLSSPVTSTVPSESCSFVSMLAN